jgi:hypothetical protein
MGIPAAKYVRVHRDPKPTFTGPSGTSASLLLQRNLCVSDAGRQPVPLVIRSAR